MPCQQEGAEQNDRQIEKDETGRIEVHRPPAGAVDFGQGDMKRSPAEGKALLSESAQKPPVDHREAEPDQQHARAGA